jgi:hypothetical protein
MRTSKVISVMVPRLVKAAGSGICSKVVIAIKFITVGIPKQVSPQKYGFIWAFGPKHMEASTPDIVLPDKVAYFG